MRRIVYFRCAHCLKVWDMPDRRQPEYPRLRPQPLYESLDFRERSDDQVQRLREENAALRYAALSFGELAERLNIALRREQQKRESVEQRRSPDDHPV